MKKEKERMKKKERKEKERKNERKERKSHYSYLTSTENSDIINIYIKVPSCQIRQVTGAIYSTCVL